MRIIETPTDEQIREARQRLYLELWPINKQMEAHADNAQGNGDKLNQMMEDFARIKRDLPFVKGGK